jgi:PrtD family type I secretion system ABC transporter
MLTIIIILALIFLALIQGARAFIMNRMGNWFEHQLSEKVFNNSIYTAILSKQQANSQQLRDLQTIKTYLTSPSLLTMMDLPWAIIFVIVLFVLHSMMGFLTILGGIVLIFIGIITDKITKPLLDANNTDFIKSMKYVDQSAKNAEVIYTMGFINNIIKSWQKLNVKVQSKQSLIVEKQAVLSEITKLIRTIIQIAVTGVGAYLVIRGEFSSGAIIASSTLVSRALSPFEVAITSWKGYINCKQAYERLNAAFIINTTQNDNMSLPTPDGMLDIENVFFAVANTQTYILKAITFNLTPGETLVIVGPSGSGKTTLAKLLVGCYEPNIGSIRLDGASLKDWNRSELGKHIGYLPQDVELFSGTIKENIARMDSNPDSNEVIIAAQLAGIHEMILHLPNAYDTEIGPDGCILSGGQRQRLGLARAFFGDPKILILDEPNASLDIQGEQALSTAIEIAKEKGITTVIISHRPSILNLADKIMILKDGVVAALGSKPEMINQVNKLLTQS